MKESPPIRFASSPTPPEVPIGICNSSLITLCTFSTARTKFAENFKGWLDRTFGVEHFDSSQYVATKRWISYTYVLPIYELLAQNFQTNTKLEFTDIPNSTFNKPKALILPDYLLNKLVGSTNKQ